MERERERERKRKRERERERERGRCIIYNIYNIYIERESDRER